MATDELQLVLYLLQEHNEIKRRQTEALTHITSVLEQILTCLLQQSISVSKAPPNYTRALAEFPSFDWTSIGASIVQTDNYGAAIVRWGGRDYVRRSPSNKFGEAIWFSRSVGKDEMGNNTYERLITFKPQAEAEALPNRVLSRLGH